MSEPEKRNQNRPKFLCDAMLGSLARWLRFFGFDTTYLNPGVADTVLAELALSEGRWLLTRDRELAAVGPRTVLVRTERLDDQLVEVLSRLSLCPAANLKNSRCGECNGTLHGVEREDVTDLIPTYVFATATRFRRCESCGRVYWPGTHSARIVDRMQACVDRLNG
jgi:uncharacterized protein with PIN domain